MGEREGDRGEGAPGGIAPELLACLADPEDHAPLAALDREAVERLRARVADGTARRADGGPIPGFDGALVPPSRRVAYLIEGGLPNLLVDDRLELDPPLA